MRYKRIVIMSDSGPHFACSLFLAHMLCHMMREYRHLQSVAVSFAPPGHGKCPCDGEFGRLRSFRDTLARMHWVDSVSQYASLLQGHAERLYEKCTSRPLWEFISYEPPPKKELMLAVLDDDDLRKTGFGIRSTPYWESKRQRPGDTWGRIALRTDPQGDACCVLGTRLRRIACSSCSAPLICAIKRRFSGTFWEQGFGGLHARLARSHSSSR